MRTARTDVDLNQKMIAAARNGGWLGDLTTDEADVLYDRGHAQYVTTTGRWVLTDTGIEAARRVEAELAAGGPG
jgi:hypothetical protein